MRITPQQYLKGFVSIYGPIAGLPILTLLGHLALPESDAAWYLFPPLGDFELPAFILSAGILLTVIPAIYFWRRSRRRLHPWVPLVFGLSFLTFAVVFVTLGLKFVVTVPVTFDNSDRTVTIGYQRTNLALQFFKGKSEREMLHIRGPWEEQIHILWTDRSILIVRLSLWITYCLAWACFLALFCLFVYQHAAETAQKKP